MHEVSSGPRARVVSIVEALQIDIRGNYVACIYDITVWYGIVNDISEEFGDLLIKFMHPSGPMNKFVFHPPSLTSSRGYTRESLKKA